MAREVKRKRVNGAESRVRILDAATEIAGERGYDGTSIALVSERSGLPASSIYWHFEDKDHLIAAVIERSFNHWLDGMGAWVPKVKGATRQQIFAASMAQSARALTEAPDFLRLGLMLGLERRPKEATARNLFLQVREQAYKRIVTHYATFFDGELDDAAVRSLATLTMAGTDGLFIAREVNPERVDFDAQFELLAAALLGAAKHLSSRSERSAKRAVR
jgi:AcrR family transcriptional regulator